ncbi:MAG: signal peptidase II [Nocardioidaceae bacterium]
MLAADLAVKAAVAALVPPGQQLGPLMPLTNRRFMLGVAGALPIAMTALMTAGVMPGSSWPERWCRMSPTAAGLMIGGAAANTVDPGGHGAAQDYLLIGHVVVNLADMAVVTGLILTATRVGRRAVPTP